MLALIDDGTAELAQSVFSVPFVVVGEGGAAR
jgi:hypothetical protein